MDTKKLDRDEEREMARILDLVPDPLTIIQDGQIVLVNSTFRRTFEVREGELGEGIDFLQVVHPDERTEVFKRYQDRLAGARPDETKMVRFRCVTLRGNSYPCETSGRVIIYRGREAVLYVVRIITERVAVEHQLQLAIGQLEATMQALPDLLFELDFEGTIHDFRAPNPDLLYVPPEQFLGKNMIEVLPPEAAKAIAEGLAMVKNEGRCHGLAYPLEVNGDQRWFELSAAGKEETDDVDGRVVCLVRDITDRKRSEQALTEKNIALEQVLEHMDRTKADYRKEIWSSLSESILPLVRKLRGKASPDCVEEVDRLEEQIRLILAGDREAISAGYERLTSRESQICDLIRDGLSTKEIAEKLNLSDYTVSKHREHIRDKLGLRGRGISLPTYLRLK